MADISKITTPDGTYDLKDARVPSGALFTDTYPSAYCDSSASSSAKTAKCSGFVLTANTYIHVLVTVANTKKAKLTLNINSTGAKDIYINGAVSSSTNYTLPAGAYIVFVESISGTIVYKFRTDGKIPADISGNASTATTATSADTATSATTADTADFAKLLTNINGNGDWVSSGTKSVANNTNTICTAFPLQTDSKGLFLVIASVKYPAVSSSSNAWRYTQISASSGTTDSPLNVMFVDNINMTASNQYIARLVGFVNSANMTDATLYLKAWHNAGSTITVEYSVQRIKIANNAR